MPFRRFGVARCGLLFAFCAAIPAQSPLEADVERLSEAVEEGRDRAVLEAVDSLRAGSPGRPEWSAAAAKAAENCGERARAEIEAEAWLKAAPDDRAARLFRLRQLRRRGRFQDAEALAAPWLTSVDPAPEDRAAFDLGAAGEIGRCRVESGRDADAEALFDAVIAESQRVVVKDPGDLAGLAESYLHFGGKGVDAAENVLVELQKRFGDPYVSLRLAEVYWDRKCLPGDAVEETKAALKARPNFTDALRYQSHVYGEWTNAEDHGAKASAALAWCLDVDPGHAEANCDMAQRAISDFQVLEGRRRLEVALATEPRNLRALSLMAAADYLDADRAGADRRFSAVLALDPTFGEGRRLLADLLNERRRWPEALDEAKKAAAIDPGSFRIWDDVARYALFLAQTPVGTDALKKANELDAYNRPWRRNMETVLDFMRRRYVSERTERFLVRTSEKERAGLKLLYGPFFDRSFDLLTKKYGYVPEGAAEAGGRVVVEMFDDSSDFSARTFGYVYPGFLGVCFGPLVTLNGPRAMPPEQNSWARTFHHEFAHSITVGLARGRMTRWLTEGLSTYEEFSFEPSWTRGMDRELFDAWATDDLCRIANFDSHFRGSRINFAYFQAGLVAEHLVRTYGMAKVVDLLRGYGDDLDTAAAFKRALGVSPEDVDRAFKGEVGRKVAAYRLQPRYSDAQLRKLEADAAKRLEDAEVAVRLAWARYQNGRRADAEAALAKARRLAPADPRLAILEARRALDVGRVDEAEKMRADLAARGVLDYDLSLGLARAAERAKRLAEAEALYREALGAFPDDPGPPDPRLGVAPRVALVKLLDGQKRFDEAMELREAHLLRKSEEMKYRAALVEWRLKRGEKDAARKLLDLFVLIEARSPEAHAQRGELQFASQEFDGAWASAEVGLDLLAGVAEKTAERTKARLLSARALRKLGRYEEARVRLAEAAAEAPEDADVRALAAEFASDSGAESGTASRGASTGKGEGG